MSSFVGRGTALDQIMRALAQGRRVTLVGPGGVGKTRVALRAAELIASEYPGGAGLVELAAVEGARLRAA